MQNEHKNWLASYFKLFLWLKKKITKKNHNGGLYKRKMLQEAKLMIAFQIRLVHKRPGVIKRVLMKF